MFGYVKAHTAELRVRENEFYRAVYCGLCASMKKLTGTVSTFSLSYDTVFLALVRMAVSGERCDVRRRRCVMNPCRLKKCSIMENGRELSYAASVSALLTECKLSDDLSDEKGFRRAAAKILKRGAKRRLIRAKLPPELDGYVREKLSQLYELEAECPETVSSGAEIFGELLGYIFSFGYDGAEKRILYEIGRGVGRYIYIIDAVDDLADDIKKNRYNAIYCGWRCEISDGVLSERAREAILDAVKLELSRAAGSVELISVPDGGYPETLEIAKNILYYGLPREAARVLSGENKKDKHKNHEVRS